MPEFTYHTIRYTPNLIRDEWINVGVVLQDPTNERYRVRMIEEESEFARIRRLHPSKHEDTLRALGTHFENVMREHKAELIPWTEKFNQTLGDTVQLGPRTAVLGDDIDLELDRLYHEKVEPIRVRLQSPERADSRSGIRQRANEVFKAAGLWSKLTRSVRVDEFTFRGDPFRIDYSYRRNGTRGFLQALALSRDPNQAKVLAYTADAIRTRLISAEFFAVTETEPQLQGNERHRFVSGLLEEKAIQVLPLSKLPAWAYSMRALIQ